MSKNNIFEVDVKGLRQLQEGKPKWHVIRELLQNAMDEEITKCAIYMKYEYGKAHITVDDDSPIGFRDLADAYTLFKDTYKRADVKKRGRFNFGEKQVLCLADYARIISTSGGLEFEVLKGTRTTLRKKREKGSEVYVVVKMTREEYNECREYCNSILVPINVSITVNIDGNETELEYKEPHLSFFAKLPTEVKEDDRMRNVSRAAEIYLHKKRDVAYVYELGIPVCEIDCDYSIDIQQKVPLSNDRDKVDAKYLKTLYGEVLNQTIDEISSEQSSNLWVRDGFTSDRAEKDTKKDILTKRFGEKALIATPNDKRSMDEAISHNYNVVHGSEMSKEEWAAIRQDNLMSSTSAQFKVNLVNGKPVKPTREQKAIGDFAAKVAKEFLRINLSVVFLESPEADTKADYGNDTLRFNVSHFSKPDWELQNGTVKQEMLDLIIHELGHSAGWHYEHSYHECITALGSKLTLKALSDPAWFKL